MESTYNWSFHSIAGAYLLSLTPQAYYLVNLAIATKGKASNQTPRENLNSLRKTLPPATWNKLFRAHSAHLNALEGFPVFAAAMIAGNVAQLPASDLNPLAGQYIGVRILYTALYIGARSELMSYMRSGVWAWSIGLPLYGLVKAGRALDGNI